MKLFLIRHGQTDCNVQMVFSGQSNAMLTDQGKQQAQALQPVLSKIPFDRVYSSDLTRAIDTQKLAIPRAKGIQEPLLREIDTGSVTGITYQKVRETYGETNSNYTPFGGENPAMVMARFKKFLKKLENEPCDYVAAFTHNGTMKYALRLLLGPESNVAAIENQNCNIGVLRYDGQKWTLVCWNYAGNI